MMHEARRLEAAYRNCERMARRHYENFPVASRLLARPLRRPVAVLYAFAREADDLADEGGLPAVQRRARLDEYSRELENVLQGQPVCRPVFIALADVLRQYALPPQPLRDLLSAFRQDTNKTRHENFAEILDYCRRSANPVGRLLLHLHGQENPALLALSDKICTALQLLNFHQDIAQDIRENDRIYLPLNEMHAYRISEEDIRLQRNSPALQALLILQYRRTREWLLAGAPLGWQLHGGLAWQVRLTVHAALHLLEQLEVGVRDNPYARPRLRLHHWPVLLWKSLSRMAPQDHDA